MAGKNRLMARLVASSATIVPDSDYIATNLTKTQAQAASLSVYSSIDSLPLSAAAGTKAIVTSTNTLYIYNNGWYKIAIINAFNPQWITQPNGSYVLAIDGSITTITVLASDSDDVPITYIAVTDSDFDAFATVTHDSDKHNTWTVTPTATTGSYTGTVTFRASDGVNYVQANSSFSLSFGVTDSRYTYALIQADDTQTDAQVDASSNNSTIGEVGNAASTAFTPYHPGGYSTYFDGTDDGLSLGDTTTFKFLHDKTVNYTIEGWIYSTDNSTRRTIFATDTSSGASGVLLENNSGYFRYVVYTGTGGVFTLVNGPAISLNTWHHFAVTFDGTSIRIFKDGVLDSDTTWSLSGSTSNQNYAASIGNDTNSVISDMSGYIADFRIVNGSVVYDSDFSVPTGRLTAISGTSLLTCHLPYIADGSTNNHSITVTGNVSTARVGPFNYLSYSRSSHGGSVYFDGADDYLTVDGGYLTTNTTWWNSSGFTFEVWLYQSSVDDTWATIWDNRIGGNTNGFIVMAKSTGLYMFANNADRAVDLGESILNQWQHVALVCSGTTGKFFQNGVQVGSDFTIPDTSSYTYFGRSQNTIGAIQYTPRGADDEYNGYMSDLRISSGSRYTGTFTPPTQIFTDDSNTILLTCTNKNNIWDAAAGARILKSSQVDSSTTKRKWTTVDSVYHAGSNDQYGFIMPSTLADDFTIESWFDHDAWNDTQNGFFYFHGGGYYLSGFGSGSSLRLKIWNTGYDYTIQQNAEMDVLRDSGWWHFALCRTGGSSYKAFVNGTQVATFTLSGDTTQRIQVGRGGGSTKEFLGYSQDFRVTNGLARYTTNFTVPSAQFEG